MWAGLILPTLLFALGAEALSPQYLDYLGNVATITSAVQTFGAMEKRFPKSFDELARSPYLAVDPRNLLNPYTGKPMQVTAEVSLGDFGFVSTPEGVVVRMYYHTGEVGDTLFSELTYSKRDLELWKNLASNGNKTFDPDKDLQKLSEKDRTAYFNCTQLTEIVHRATLDPYPKAELAVWDTLVLNHRIFNWNVRNPYTGGIATNVTTPSAGDFTYKMFYFSGQFTPIFLCYGAKGRALSRSVTATMERLKGHEYRPPKP